MIEKVVGWIKVGSTVLKRVDKSQKEVIFSRISLVYPILEYLFYDIGISLSSVVS